MAADSQALAAYGQAFIAVSQTITVNAAFSAQKQNL
jgi:hypothetical protein